VTQLAAAVNLSESRAAHLFKEAVGISLHKYITNLKISNSKELLQNTDMSIFEISAMVGYDDPLYFSRLFKAACGISPRNYRKTR
jgi:AraC-like DNA-binding protein